MQQQGQQDQEWLHHIDSSVAERWRSRSSSLREHTPPTADEIDPRGIFRGGTTDSNPPTNPKPRPKPNNPAPAGYQAVASRFFKSQDSGFFRRGRVFAVQISDRSSDDIEVLGLDAGRFDVREYVVIRENAPDSAQHCLVLQLSTYGGRGLAKQGVVKADHGIIYSGQCNEPRLRKEELPARYEAGACAVSIRVQMTRPSVELQSELRINYKAVVRISKTTKVYNVGFVHQDSIAWLVGQFETVQKRDNRYNEDHDDEEEEDDDDDDDSDNAEDAAPSFTQARPFTSSSRSSATGSRQQAQIESSESIRVEAQSARNAYNRLLYQGKTPREALTAIAQNLQRRDPGMSSTEAIAAARGRLQYREP